jgi:hypothetical protein
MQSNNNSMNNNQMSHERYHHNTAQLQAQLQQHLSGGYNMSNGMSGGGGNNVGNNYQNVMLSELPEPPMSIGDIGPIPPPAMFSTPSPTMVAGRPHGPGMHGHQEYDYDGELIRIVCMTFPKSLISYFKSN